MEVVVCIRVDKRKSPFLGRSVRKRSSARLWRERATQDNEIACVMAIRFGLLTLSQRGELDLRSEVVRQGHKLAPALRLAPAKVSGHS